VVLQPALKGFLEPVHRELLLIEEQPNVLLDRLTVYGTSQSWTAAGDRDPRTAA
jgi:hypothetical protein